MKVYHSNSRPSGSCITLTPQTYNKHFNKKNIFLIFDKIIFSTFVKTLKLNIMYRFKMVFQYRKGETIDWSNPHSIDADTFEEAAAILFKQKDVAPMIVKEIELISQTPILTRTQLFNLAHPNFEG